MEHDMETRGLERERERGRQGERGSEAKIHMHIYGDFSKMAVHFGGPNSKDYITWGSILGSPYFGKLPYIYME